jgi:hypothetical protein
MLALGPDNFRTPKRPGETDQDHHPVADADQDMLAGGEQLPEVSERKCRCLARGLIVLAQDMLDRRMVDVKGRLPGSGAVQPWPLRQSQRAALALPDGSRGDAHSHSGASRPTRRTFDRAPVIVGKSRLEW